MHVFARLRFPGEKRCDKKDPTGSTCLILTLQSLVAYFYRFQHILGPFRTAHESRLE